MENGEQKNFKFTIQGKIHKIYDLQEIETKRGPFLKRDFLLEYNTREYEGRKFSDIVKMKADGQRAEGVELYSEGDEVEVDFVLSGRMWTNKEGKEVNFTEAKVIWMKKLNHTPPEQEEVVRGSINDLVNNAESDDLPF